MTRKEALIILADLPDLILEAVGVVVETAEAQEKYYHKGLQVIVWEDDVRVTLNSLAKEIRDLK